MPGTAALFGLGLMLALGDPATEGCRTGLVVRNGDVFFRIRRLRRRAPKGHAMMARRRLRRLVRNRHAKSIEACYHDYAARAHHDEYWSREGDSLVTEIDVEVRAYDRDTQGVQFRSTPPDWTGADQRCMRAALGGLASRLDDDESIRLSLVLWWQPYVTVWARM